MKILLVSCLLAFSSLTISLSAVARDILTFSPQQMQQSVPKLQVWNGSGLNINLCGTGHFIQKAWLDDPSRLTVDFNPPLNTGKTCVVHLRRINPLNFQVLPQTPQTLLSLATSQGVYQFVIGYGDGTPQYYGVRVDRGQPTRDLPVDWAIRLRRGLSQAQEQGLISDTQGNTVLIGRVNRFIEQVNQGQSFEVAATASGVSLPFIRRLQELGTNLETSEPTESTESTESTQSVEEENQENVEEDTEEEEVSFFGHL